MFVFLDAGPLGIITAPQKKTSEPIAAAHWVFDMEAAGHRFIVPAIADYEVRRELIRAQKLRGINRLNTFNAADPNRFLPLTESALPLRQNYGRRRVTQELLPQTRRNLIVMS